MKLRIFTIKRVTGLCFVRTSVIMIFAFITIIKTSVSLEKKKTLLIKFTRNYIRDPHSVISISSLARIVMTSLSVFLTVVSAVSLS